MDSFKILTKKGSGHRETEVTIDWTGITEDQLKLLAGNALIHDLQARIYKDIIPFPEKIMLNAAELSNRRPIALDRWQPPESTGDVKVSKKLEDLLRELSPIELATLLG